MKRGPDLDIEAIFDDLESDRGSAPVVSPPLDDPLGDLDLEGSELDTDLDVTAAEEDVLEDESGELDGDDSADDPADGPGDDLEGGATA